jgi:predicted amidohydrolase YtcJ
VLYLYSQGYLNAAGVRALGITAGNAADRAPEGTRYELTEDGGAVLHAEPNPTILYGTIGALPPMDLEHQTLSTRHFYRELARFGLTSVIDAGGGGHTFPEDYAGTRALVEAGEMPIRVSNYLFPQRPGEELADFRGWTEDFARNVNLAERLSEGFVVEGGGEFLTWSAGDFENFMAPRPELLDRPGYAEELMDVTRHLLQAGWPIRIHATYDESARLIMDVFEEAHRLEREAGRSGFRGVRWAIDHAETIRPDTLDRVARLGGGIASQARMAYAGELFADRYGEKAASNAPPIADIIARGIPLGLGTDATRVASYNPWSALDYYTTGRTVGGTRLMGERHSRSREEALWLYTVGSAWFSGEEAMKGRLAPGQFADFAVLDRDYLSVPDDEIARIESLLTVTAGTPRYAAGPFSGLVPDLPPILPDWSPIRAFGGHQSS